MRVRGRANRGRDVRRVGDVRRYARDAIRRPASAYFPGVIDTAQLGGPEADAGRVVEQPPRVHNRDWRHNI